MNPSASKSARRHWAWAALVRRAFDLDVLACPRCGGRLRLIATVEDPEVLAGVLGRGAPLWTGALFWQKIP
jgi:hypothetical protein